MTYDANFHEMEEEVEFLENIWETKAYYWSLAKAGVSQSSTRFQDEC